MVSVDAAGALHAIAGDVRLLVLKAEEQCSAYR